MQAKAPCTATKAWVIAAALAVPGACSQHAAQAAKQPDISALDKVEGARCSLASSQPLVVDWSPTRRGALESALWGATLVVKYTGCKLEILDQCHPIGPEAKYSYIPISPKHEEHEFKTADDVYAQMPVGAAQLEAELQSSGALRLEMNVVGRYESRQGPVKSNELEGGGCDTATHVVKAVSVGAFRLFSVATVTEYGSAKAASGSVRATGSAAKKSLSEDGNVHACANAARADVAPPDGCAALIRLELAPIESTPVAPVVRRDKVCPAGMTVVEDGGCIPDENPRAGAADPADGTAAGDGRFVPADDTVFDTSTGLTWQRYPAAERLSWEQAKAFCRSLSLAGESGWRLPKKAELETLVAKQSAPKIDKSMFPATPPEPFWTFSPDPESPGEAIAIDFSTGRKVSLGIGSQRAVRCVR